MRWLKAGWSGVLLCCVAPWLHSAAAAAEKLPTVESLLAEQDEALVKQLVAWNKTNFLLPDDLVLDPPVREAADQMVREHVERLGPLVTAWIAEERAARQQPALRGADLSKALYLRSINETAIETVESVGSAHDEAWLKAALTPNACKWLPPGYFARRIAMIQAAPQEARPILLAAEKELLSRWGKARQGLAPRPAAADLVAAEHAVTRLRGGLPVAAAPMTPHLAAAVFARTHPPGNPNRWEQCARSQWWLQSQLADGKADRARALAVYRYSTMLDANDFMPTGYKAKPGAPAPASGKPAYPLAASYFHVEGLTTTRVSLDGQGKAGKAEVIARTIKVPGVRGERPVAGETLLDEAAIDYARQRSYPPGTTGETEFEMQWNLDKDGNEAQ